MNPSSVKEFNALVQAALAAKAGGELARAAEALQRALRIVPRQARVWLLLGDVQEDLGRIADSELSYRRAGELEPALADAHYNQARVLAQLGRAAEARRAVQQALRSQPQAANMLQLRAMLEEQAGELPAALATLDQAIAAAPERAALHHNRAVVLQRSHRHADSLAAHERAQALGLDVADAHYNHGNTLQSLGRGEAAKAAYRRALAHDPLHALTLYDLARLRFSLGEAGFCEELEAAERAVPASAVASGIRGLLLLKAERFAEAVQAYETAVARAPGVSGYQDGLGHALSALGRHEPALAAHARAAALGPADASVHSNFAHSLLAAGQPAQAAEAAATAHRLAPEDQHALAQLGLAWRQLGDAREPALNDYARFVRVFDLEPPPGWPDMASFNAALAEALAALHTDAREPVDQTLRRGTQTRGNLFELGHPLVDALKLRLSEAITRYVSELPADAAHPFLRRRAANGAWHFTDSWSSRLKSQGFHTNHVHTHGWISSCYYVALPPSMAQQGPDGQAGWIKFGEPDMDIGLAALRAEQPQPGRLVLFPSYFWHGTVPFEDAHAPRLTIAFDIKPSAP